MKSSILSLMESQSFLVKRNIKNLVYGLLFVIGGSNYAVAQLYTLSAKQGWLETSVMLDKDEKFEISATGTWTNGGANPQWVGPQGWPNIQINSTLAPNLGLGALIGKVGDKVFNIGSQFKGNSPAAGRLYLSMNDNDFSDNDGAIQVTVKPVKIIISNPPINNFSFIESDRFLSILQSFLSDGRVQLSQTGEGVPLAIKSSNGSTVSQMSYLSFGAILNGLGIKDIAVPLPSTEWSPEQIKDLGGLTIFAQFAATHGAVFCDRFRFLVNNIHASFASDLSLKLGTNEIILDLSLHSPDPTIRAEGNGYTTLPFGIPIPLGWEDGLCPDILIKEMGLTIHLVPNVAADGTLHLKDPSVDIRGSVSINNFDWLPFANVIKDKIMNSFQQSVQDALRSPNTKKGLESGIFGAFSFFTGKQNVGLSGISIDPSGIDLFFKR